MAQSSEPAPCPVCGSDKGKKLEKGHVVALAHSFWVGGTMMRGDYGAAPVVQCNDKDRQALIDCLEPNRRVKVEEITVTRQVR